MSSYVTRRRIEAAIGTLGDLTTDDELDGAVRDEIGHVIQALEDILDTKVAPA